MIGWKSHFFAYLLLIFFLIISWYENVIDIKQIVKKVKNDYYYFNIKLFVYMFPNTLK